MGCPSKVQPFKGTESGSQRVLDAMTKGTTVEQIRRAAAVCREAGIEVVFLAGYLRLIPARVVQRYRGRMLNVHPALLPFFGGAGMYGDFVMMVDAMIGRVLKSFDDANMAEDTLVIFTSDNGGATAHGAPCTLAQRRL